MENSKISVIKDNYTQLDDVLFYNRIASKYEISTPGIRIKSQDIEKLFTFLRDKDPEVSIINFPVNKQYNSWVVEGDNYLFSIGSTNMGKRLVVDIYSTNYELHKVHYDFLKGIEDTSEDVTVGIYSYFLKNGNLADKRLEKKIEDFKSLDSDYYPYLDLEEMFNQFILSDSNTLVLTGKPGTGKTKMVDLFLKYLLTSTVISQKNELDKSLHIEREKEKVIELGSLEDLDELEASISELYEYEELPVAYVKNEKILSMDEFWTELAEGNYKLVILDDLDYGLLPRTQEVSTNEDVDKNKFLSQFLSFTDGIFESGNNTKFIITTNRESEEIDTAVLRKGRTFEILDLPYLQKEEALSIWTKNDLTPEEFETEFPDIVELASSDLGTAIGEKLSSKKLKIDHKPYLKRDGISTLVEIKKDKKIGF